MTAVEFCRTWAEARASFERVVLIELVELLKHTRREIYSAPLASGDEPADPEGSPEMMEPNGKGLIRCHRQVQIPLHLHPKGTLLCKKWLLKLLQVCTPW